MPFSNKKILIISCFIILFFITLVKTTKISATNVKYQKIFDKEYDKFVNSKRYPYVLRTPYSNLPYLSGLSSMYEATQDHKYLNSALDLIEASFDLQKDIDGDGYLEWESYSNLSPLDHDKNPKTPPRLSCLYTQRGVREFARVARLAKNSTCGNENYKDRANKIIQRIKKDIVNDPSCYKRFEPGFKTVHHIVSHPLVILLNLYLAGEDTIKIKGKTYKIVDILKSQAESMKSTQFNQPGNDGTIFWGSTSCEEIRTYYPTCYFVNVTGVPSCKDSKNTPWCQPSDVSHAKDYVSAVIELYRSGITYNQKDITALSNTFTKKIWNQSQTHPKFKDFLDGNLESEGGKYGAWVMGSKIAPGWVSLGAFDARLQTIFTRVDPKSTNIIGYYGEIVKNSAVRNCKYSNRAIEILDGVDNDCNGMVDENNSCQSNSTCPGNLIGNSCDINTEDLLDLLSKIIERPKDNNPKYDINSDGQIDIIDLLYMISLMSK